MYKGNLWVSESFFTSKAKLISNALIASSIVPSDEKINDSQGNFVGVYLTKSNNDPRNEDKMDNEVDAISGATITGDGVSDMIIERVQNYLPYFNNISNE